MLTSGSDRGSKSHDHLAAVTTCSGSTQDWTHEPQIMEEEGSHYLQLCAHWSVHKALMGVSRLTVTQMILVKLIRSNKGINDKCMFKREMVKYCSLRYLEAQFDYEK